MALPAWRRYRWILRPPETLTMALKGHQGPIIFLLYFALLFSSVSGNPDAPHITAIAGDKITLNCDVNFPNGVVSPYVVQWWRKGAEVPFYIWYDDYPEHASQDYKGRVSKVNPGGQYGLASLNISTVKDTDRGWYNCKVLFLNREPNNAVNGTWYFVEVQAKPRFEHRPDPVVYVNLQDSTVLACTAVGNPPPEILWFKGKAAIKESSRVAVVNGNTELRISHIRDSDLDEYTCLARNGVDNIQFTTRLVQAGAAVIVRPPENQTVLENAEVKIPCEGEAEPANLTVRWYKDGIPVHKMGTLGQRTSVLSDGTLQIRLITSEDNGWYTCEITNGIGRSITERAYINVEYPARVVFTPTVQYIPRGLKGIIKCETDATPPITYITWKKDSRLFDPFNTAGIMALLNGSLLIDQVSHQHAGQYQCQPFNQRGSAGPSPIIQVIIKDPPTLLSRPNSEYIKNVGASVSFSCQAAGTPTPEIRWRRVDGRSLPERRISFLGGEMTLSDLRKSDHGVYECVVSNEVATIVARTALLIERTTPHAPTNVTVTSSETFAVTIEWHPGYSGCTACQQTYKIRYRETDSKSSNWNWIELPVNPPDARKVKIHNLTPRTKYEFQVIGMNEFGDGMYSEIIEAQTKDITYFDIRLLPRDNLGNIIFPQIPKSRDVPPGERPPPATNLTLTQEAGGWVLRWQGPKEPDPNLLYYTIEKKKDSQGELWKRFADYIDVEEASYMMKSMGAAKAYSFRVLSHYATSFSISEELKYDLPENVKRRAVTAGLIGGILFFIVAIVLSVCTVKICNKRRRRKHDRAVNEIQRQSVPSRFPTESYPSGLTYFHVIHNFSIDVL